MGKNLSKNAKVFNQGHSIIRYDDKKKRWRCTVTSPDGHRKDFCNKYKEIAESKAQEYINNNFVTVKKQTVGEYCQMVIDKKFEYKYFSTNTYNTYFQTVKRIKRNKFGDIKIQKITVDDIKEYFDNVNVANSTINTQDRNILNFSLEWAVNEGIIEKNPLKDEKLKNYTKVKDDYTDNDIDEEEENEKVIPLTEEEQEKLLNICYNDFDILYPYSAMMLILLFTGMRIGELIALEWSDIDYKKKTIYIHKTLSYRYIKDPKDPTGHTFLKNEKGNFLLEAFIKNIPKNKKNRKIYLNKEIKDILEKIKKEKNDKYIFIDPETKSYYKYKTIKDEVNKINKKNNISKRFTLHMLRHTYVTRAIEEGADPVLIQHLVGHASLDFTLETYFKFFEPQYQGKADKISQYWLEEIENIKNK